VTKKPERLTLEEDQIEELKERLSSGSLSNDDKKILSTILDVYVWLYSSLQEARISISRLKSFFGFSKKTEKGRDWERREGDTQDGSTHCLRLEAAKRAAAESNTDDETSKKKVKKKGHGRLGHKAYTGATTVDFKHGTLKSGDRCPTGCGGKLYRLKPIAFVCLTGNALASATRYMLEKLRCSSCGKTYTASLWPGVQKYDAYLKANLAVAKNFMGLPFNRIAQLQKMVGVPLPASTQFDLTDSLVNDVHIIYKTLADLAPQAPCTSYDDTWNRVQSIVKENKKNPDRRDRKGVHTTAILSSFETHTIALFVTGRQHAGENMTEFLLRRVTSLPPPICMSDALSSNTLPKTFKAIVLNCLNHGRRKFYEIREYHQEPCNIVLDTLGLIYHYDSLTKVKKMTPKARLEYHQALSLPLLTSLKGWIHEQFDHKKAEPNSSLGRALRYMLNHWDKLTRFLYVEGGLLDNNPCERILKTIIRCRKNSLFYKTEHGAHVGCVLTSLIQTCVLAGENPVHYLVSLQHNKKAMLKNPLLWLPWNYRQQLEGEKEALRVKAA
jgi:transcription elongation factor Elf1